MFRKLLSVGTLRDFVLPTVFQNDEIYTKMMNKTNEIGWVGEYVVGTFSSSHDV